MTSLVRWRTCKRLLLLFWAVWLSMVVATNLADALRSAGLLVADSPWASGNYATILEVTAPFELPHLGARQPCIAGVIAWEGVSMLLFWMAAIRFPPPGSSTRGCH